MASKGWTGAVTSGSWGDAVVRSVLIAVVGFATLSLKDGIESGDWGDWAAPLTDASSIGAVMFLLTALLRLLKRPTA